MREIAEAGVIGDRADGPLRQPGIAQHAMRAGKALVEQEPRECRSLALEQHLHVARGDAMACRKVGERQFVTVQAVEDFHFDRMQARRAHAAAIRSLGGISRRAERERHEIVDMADHDVVQFGCRQALVLDEMNVFRQQLQRFVLARDRPQETIFEAWNYAPEHTASQRYTETVRH